MARTHPQVVSIHHHGKLELPQAKEARGIAGDLGRAAHHPGNLPAQQLLPVGESLARRAGKTDFCFLVFFLLLKGLRGKVSTVFRYK